MHKEVIVRSKIRILISILLVIVIALYLERFIDIARFNNNGGFTTTDLGLVLLTSIVVFYELLSVNLKYKYSIIADKLIVNRSLFRKEKNLVSIRTSDILYVGKKKDMPKSIKGKSIGSYSCNVVQQGEKVCIFKQGEELYKFNFNPSDRLVNKLNICHK